ncbi:glycosyltransferase [Leptobacterium flavescens]|uniref:Glycosyltransferase n=1 Tax=Leptobacterium flavescens TaxID=472055 RepID=A0A6P0UM86_9FLAO|nr:glycosyltransferase family 4 protein [Leptobacterium flavescens]NER12163.1 glycosyltransferase [Leptobacterium flavescens]
MKRILYIGNKLADKNRTATSIDTLGVLLENEGYKLYYSSSKENKVLRLIDMLLSCINHRKKADVVLIDTYSTQNFYFAFLVSQLSRWLKLPYIPILHGGNLENRLKNNPRLCKKIFNHARINISPSEFLKVTFEKYGFDNVEYIPNSVEIEKYRWKQRTDLKARLLWVRSFAGIYNPEMAVEVSSELNKQGIESLLCMVGPDKDGSMITTKNLANAKGVEIKLTGKLEKEEWHELSEEYDIFINTTNFDNMPVSIIEAMALGLPVVSTEVGGIPYLLKDGENSLLVEKGNSLQMAARIRELLGSPALTQKLSCNARKKAEAFNWDEIKHKWMETLS